MIYKRQHHALISRQVCTIPNDGDNLYISWKQRISKKGNVVGTGYFIQTPYRRNRDGLRRQILKRILAAGNGTAY
jgi:hypothetical protein